ncbi:trans-Golgi network integral membrane protein TGN38-like isoform X2 [Achroia grisella]|uniref:trans-Golgi network integral membrane protein TGN38-like isoform X2 n=1 Tax=Achroia grisella TaxID=688607 RepID=UPI0027D31A27|nr:trans-Golgi network integral membrane protein TGN38-like isoform X2 [Achroia grisella]
MLRYVLPLLIINSYFGSLGAPPNNLATLLTALAKRCQNSFVVTHIENQIEECNELNPSMKRKFECLIFYDINNQLCTAVSQLKLNITEDYTEKINKKHDVKSLCEAASGWTFSNLSEKYLADVKLVFQNSFKCASLCEVEDFNSDDSIFYCKYYNWGWEMLNPQPKSTPQVSSVVIPVVSDTSATGVKTDETQVNNSDEKDKDIVPNLKQSDIKTELTSVKTSSIKTNDVNADSIGPISTLNKETPEVISNAPEKVSEINNVQPISNIKKVDANAKGSDENVISPNENVKSPDENVKVSSENVKGSAENVKPTSENVKSTSENIKNPGENIKSTGVDLPVNIPISVSGDQLNNVVIPQPDVKKEEGANNLLNQIEIPKDIKQSDADDYQGNELDSEEGKEGLSDTLGNDDGDDPDLSDLDVKPVLDESKNIPKRIQSSIQSNSFNADISQREFYPNTIQEDFTEDDDHFFPFFLTAIILVVLLYVLYHNKNKVLGLIVEGRQPGRRRNSRGHAYRRLDTLEQAMSGNLAAPPSKIIY